MTGALMWWRIIKEKLFGAEFESDEPVK